MSQLLAEKTAVVTGASSGIGRAISLTFAENGADVVVADIRQEPREGGKPTHELIESDTDRQARFVECDVTERSDVEMAVEAADEFGGIDVMVNNAGIHSETPLLEITDAEYDELMDVNVKGVFLGSQIAGRHLVENGGGAIINMSSMAADRGAGHQTIYSASKGAVKSFTYALADYFGGQGVRVNAIKPSYTETQMIEESGMGEGEEGKQYQAAVLGATPAGRFGEPEEIAEMALFLASDRSSYVNGESILVDGGLGNT